MKSAQPKQWARYPIGTPGVPWGEKEKAEWLAQARKSRDYFNDFVSVVMRMGPSTHGCEAFQYGELDYVEQGAARYPVFAVRSSPWIPELPMITATGCVHGYERSGGHGCLKFLSQWFAKSKEERQRNPNFGKVNILVLPCVSPWGYEVIDRWTPATVDPNRQFKKDADPGCAEATLAMKVIAEHVARSKVLLMHVDCHETTDSDEERFVPAKHARDGLPEEKWEKWSAIPDGFYVYGDSSRERPQLEFSKAIIDAVRKVTHIAPADENGEIVGEKIAAEGVLLAPGEGTADAHTNAWYVTTTEVYPDSSKTNDEECDRAQATALHTGAEFVMKQYQQQQ